MGNADKRILAICREDFVRLQFLYNALANAALEPITNYTYIASLCRSLHARGYLYKRATRKMTSYMTAPAGKALLND